MEILEVDTRQGYDLWSASYDTNGNPLVAVEDRALNQMLGSVAGRRAVDLGCGTGRNTIKLHDLGAHVEGVDFSEGMLAKARLLSQERNIQYRQHDLTQPLPFQNGAFDLVVSSLVIEHIENLVPLFKEIGRICKKQGQILISDLHPAMKLRDAQAQFTDRQSGKDIRPKGFPHSMSEYMLAIRDSGLYLDDVREFSGTSELIQSAPKMERFIGWPMLVVFKLRA